MSTHDASPDDRREAIVRALRQVRDPEIPVNIHDLGLIYGIDLRDDGAVHIRMTLTSPNCPVAELLPGQVQAAARTVEGVTDVTVEVVWDPTWTADMMSEAAKLELEFTGHTGPAHLRKPGATSLTVGRTGRKR